MNKWTDIEYMMVALIVVSIFSLAVLAYCSDRSDKLAYSAWVKFTDNPKAITFDEWRSMQRAGILRVGEK